MISTHPDAATAASVPIPCSDRCTGRHALIYSDGTQARVRSIAEPAVPALSDELAACYPKNEPPMAPLLATAARIERLSMTNGHVPPVGCDPPGGRPPPAKTTPIPAPIDPPAAPMPWRVRWTRSTAI
jgi:hypothetical protein